MRVRSCPRWKAPFSTRTTFRSLASPKRTSSVMFVLQSLFTMSGDVPLPETLPDSFVPGMVSRRDGFLANMINPPTLPAWISEAEAEVYVEQFLWTGYRGGLNWYRNISRNRELLGAFDGLKVTVPALCFVGDRDVGMGFRG